MKRNLLFPLLLQIISILTFEKILRSDSKVVISIDGSELVKGRGGPRCMTLPIKRGLV